MAIQQSAPAPAPAAVPVPVEHVAVSEQPHQNFRAVAIVGFVVAAIDILIAGRFLLKLLGASSQSSFVGFVYGYLAGMAGIAIGGFIGEVVVAFVGAFLLLLAVRLVSSRGRLSRR